MNLITFAAEGPRTDVDRFANLMLTAVRHTTPPPFQFNNSVYGDSWLGNFVELVGFDADKLACFGAVISVRVLASQTGDTLLCLVELTASSLAVVDTLRTIVSKKFPNTKCYYCSYSDSKLEVINTDTDNRLLELYGCVQFKLPHEVGVQIDRSLPADEELQLILPVSCEAEFFALVEKVLHVFHIRFDPDDIAKGITSFNSHLAEKYANGSYFVKAAVANGGIYG